MYKKSVWKIFLSVFLSFSLAIAMLTAASATGTYQEALVDLAIDLNAPQHTKAAAELVINISYSNPGTAASPDDSWVTFTLPGQTTFVSAVDSKGVVLTPVIVENTYTWMVGSVPAGFCCRHIYVTVLVSDIAVKGDVLASTGVIGSSAVEIITENNTNTVTSTVCYMKGTSGHARTTSMPRGGGGVPGR